MHFHVDITEQAMYGICFTRRSELIQLELRIFFIYKLLQSVVKSLIDSDKTNADERY